jgi:membrane-associated phospholipid phosphatase
MKKDKTNLFKDPALTLAMGISSGVMITRIIDGGNVIGAVVAGLAIGIVCGIALKIILEKNDDI